MAETQSEARLEEKLNNLGEHLEEEIERVHEDVNAMTTVDWIKEHSNYTVGDLKVVDKKSHGISVSSRMVNNALDNFENSDMVDQKGWKSFQSGGFKLEFRLVEEE